MSALIYVEDLRGNPLGRSRIRTKSSFTARLTRDAASGAQKGGLTAKLGRVMDALMQEAVLLAQTVVTDTANEPTGDRTALYRNYFKSRGATAYKGFSSARQLKAYWATNRFRNRRKSSGGARNSWKVLYVRKKLTADLSVGSNAPETRFIYGGFTNQTNRQQPFHRFVGVRNAVIIRNRAFEAVFDFLRANAPDALADLGLLEIQGMFD